MDYLADYLPSNNALALIIASLIFIVTVALVAKKLINFLITLVLLFFAIASGMAIANNDLVREYFRHKTEEKIVSPPATPAPVVTPEKPATPAAETLDQVRDELVKILQQLATLLSSVGERGASER